MPMTAPSATASSSSADPLPLKALPAPSERTLKREISTSDDYAAEEIARFTKEAFLGSRLWSADQSNSTTVEFWVRSMISHLKNLRAKTQEVETTAQWISRLDDYASHYFRFVVTRLLETTDVAGALHVGKRLGEISSEMSPLLGPMGATVVGLLDKGLDTTTQGDLSLSHRAELFRSCLYNTVHAKSLEDTMLKLQEKAAKHEEGLLAELLAFADKLPTDSPLQGSVGFAKAWFSMGQVGRHLPKSSFHCLHMHMLSE